jgi:glycerate 2-kinase
LDDREILTRLYRAAVAAVDPAALVSEALGRRGDGVYVRSVSSPTRREFVFAPRRVVVLAVGKAAVPMTVAASASLGRRLDEALVVAPALSPTDGLPPGAHVVLARHPVPDENSLFAGEAALDLARRLRKGDLLLVLLSGGGSSLLAAPAGDLTLDDKARTSSLLMAAGAPIAEINVVRGALSRVKGGRLAAAAGDADVLTLVLSDLGDDGWHLVASAPTLGVAPRPAEARMLLERYRLGPLVPPPVRAFLERPVSAEPPAGGPRWSILLADVRTALDGARHEASRLGLEARVVPELLAGEARAAGRRLALAGASAGNLRRRSALARRLLTIFGGETTVTVRGHGRGGRNRELALSAAYAVAGVDGAAILCAGTDGVDHDESAAGAFADGTTLTRAEALGLDPGLALLDNDTGPFFEALGDAFRPGATGTNVGDVAFVLAPPLATPLATPAAPAE